jgi:hypothetical protein
MRQFDVETLLESIVDDIYAQFFFDDNNERGSATGIQYIAQKYIDAAFVTFPQNIRNSLQNVLSKSLEWYQIIE